MERLSQAPLGSNPATAEQYGLNNQLLNGEESGVTPSELKDFLNRMIRHGGDNHQEFATELQEKLDKINNPDIKDMLRKIGNAMMMGNDKRKQTKDPITGKTDPGPKELCLKCLEKLEAFNKEGSKVYNYKIAQTQLEKKKKKTRGNPFRVLMGKVGKLLDHGVEKRDIVRYLAKLKYWNNETIERAVDIVRDYNRKKERKDRDEDKNEKKSSNNSFVKTANIYEKQADFNKRSTGELVMRACFLMDLLEVDKNTRQGDFKDPVDKSGAKEQLKNIKKALVERGFDKEELSNLGLGE